VGEVGTQALAEAAGARLVPYLPRVTLDWLRDDPAARRRALAGTMAFVDVSGLTAMSERLAPKGRLGAEEVTDVMSATFGRLLGFASSCACTSACTAARSTSSSSALVTAS
jgi:class 3 adenylate cyclase